MRHRWVVFAVGVLLYGTFQPSSAQPETALAPISADNVAALETLATLPSEYPHLIRIGADNTTLYTGGRDSPFEIWNVTTQTQRDFPAEYPYGGLAISPDERLLAVNFSSDLGGFGLYALDTGETIAEVPCSGGSMTIAFSPVESELLVMLVLGGTATSSLHFWEIRPNMPNGWTPEAIEHCSPDARVEVHGGGNLTFTPDGQFLLYGNQLYEVANPQEAVTLGDPDGYGLAPAAFSPDSSLLARGGGSGVVIWSAPWDAPQSRPQVQFEIDPDERSMLQIDSLAFSPNGELLAVGGTGRLAADESYSGFVWFWNTATWTPNRLMLLDEMLPTPLTLAFSPDGTLLAVGYLFITLYGVAAPP